MPDKRFYSEPQATALSSDLLEFLKAAFTKSLSKEVWTQLMEKYPSMQGTENIFISPTMEAGMREDIKKKHGYAWSKDVLAFDDGLADRQAPFLTVARPIFAALESLEAVNTDGEEDLPGPEPEDINVMLEDAIALLGNAVSRLNSWRQRRFSEYLTDLGKRMLQSDVLPISFSPQTPFTGLYRASTTIPRPITSWSSLQPLDNHYRKKPFSARHSFRSFRSFRSQTYQNTTSSNDRRRTWGNKGRAKS